MPFSKHSSSPFVKNLWQTLIVFILFSASFIAYIYSEKQIDSAHELRLRSFLLADELRQSSDDLTRMIRTYAATGNILYKQHYQEILDIRNGKKARPFDYDNIYWDLVAPNDKRPRPLSTEQVPLIDLMRQAKFTQKEFAKLNEAKNNSDALTKTEFRAMELIETKASKEQTLQNRQKAVEILHDEAYHHAKASIMKPIYEFYNLMNERTDQTVKNAKVTTFILRIIFITIGLFFFLMLWRLYKTINEILGAPIDVVHTNIKRIGEGNFSTPIEVNKGMQNSILGWLGETQSALMKLIASNERLKQLYAALSQCNQAIVRAKEEDELFPVICRDAVNFGGMRMAWIGIVDESLQELKVVSSFGEGTQYLEGLRISTDPSNKTSKGPTGRAFCEDKAIWCQDFQKDSSTAQWHERAEAFGLASSAALPLHKNGKVIGVFTLYASETEAFDKRAQALLKEMVMDISYALESFEREKIRASMEIALKSEKETAQNYLSIVGVMILVLDTKSNIKLINRKGCELLGYDEDELLGKNWVENFVPLRFKSDVDKVISMVSKQTDLNFSTFENPILTKSGEERLILWSNTPLFDSEGNNIGILTSGEDITERRSYEQRINYLANFDELTGLANRTQLDIKINELLSLAKRTKLDMSVMFLDIDHFKDINDSLGHRIGDELLIKVSNRLQSILREVDTIARLGGDEFIIILPNIPVNGASEVAQKLLEAFGKSFQVEEHELSISGSIGIAVFPTDGNDFETLYKNADTAMYRAKKEGRNTFCFFTQEMQQNSIRHLELSNALRHALNKEQFELHYQPQFSTDTKMIIGAEALLRWKHPELGSVSPAEFIPIAEENGTIMQIGEWVLRTAIQTAKEWIETTQNPIIMAVNLSAVQFRSINLADDVAQVLEDIGLAPEYLELELTEGVAMQDPQRAINVMNNLHERGIRMSIDDFGTGYSSLSYLKKFNVYKLKIDQSFIRDINIDPEDKAIVGAVISMAKSLGLNTIAEGVETIAQLEYLHQQGCDEIQGYYFSKPLPKDEFEHFRETFLDTQTR